MSKSQLLATTGAVYADADETDEEKKTREDKARKDAEAGTPLNSTIMDAVEKCLDSMEKMADSWGRRMDAMEKRMDGRKDSAEDVGDEKAKQDAEEEEERERADKARRDAEESAARERGDPERVAADGEGGESREDFYAGSGKNAASNARVLERAKQRLSGGGDKTQKRDENGRFDATEEGAAHADAIPEALLARIRAEIAPLKTGFETLSAITPRPMNDKDAEALLRQQAMCDDVMVEFGLRAPPPQVNETLGTYRKRLMRGLQEHSPSLKDADIWAVNDSASLALLERQIYADAVEAARRPASIGPGQVRGVTKGAPGSHQITEYYGDSVGWVAELALPATRGYVMVGDMIRAGQGR